MARIENLDDNFSLTVKASSPGESHCQSLVAVYRGPTGWSASATTCSDPLRRPPDLRRILPRTGRVTRC